jgi:hypothetical protein
MIINIVAGVLVLLGVLPVAPAHAVIFGGIDFPAGAVSFADAVVSYGPVIVSVQPTAPHRDPSTALGIPDFTSDADCTGDPSCTFVSLGAGGSIVLGFTNNALTGSGNATPDLHIFEVGPDVEDTAVEISKDGLTFSPVGTVFGSTSSIDIDAFGFGPADQFFFVRLTDVAGEGATSGITVGADIDAVGAIATVPVSVPEPGVLGILTAGLAGLAYLHWRRHRRTAG